MFIRRVFDGRFLVRHSTFGVSEVAVVSWQYLILHGRDATESAPTVHHITDLQTSVHLSRKVVMNPRSFPLWERFVSVAPDTDPV